MRYPTLPQEGVFMEALIWANEICNAKFDWLSRKETKSTYEKRPFSTRESRFLIWAFPQIPPPLGNASFDWILLKETKSTYEKQPFSEEKPQDRVNPLFSPNFRNEERKIIKEGTRHTRHTRHSNTQHATRNTQQRTHATNARNKRTQQLKDFLALIWRQWSFWHLYVEGYMVRLTQRSTSECWNFCRQTYR